MATVAHYDEQAGRYQVNSDRWLVGKDPKMVQLFELTNLLADAPADVLITGETGVGKELFARALHYNGTGERPAKPFVAVNCPAIAPSLLESELFGHVKGAFTDAKRDNPGYFVAANGGTIFLDEIGELPTYVQAKLLRVIQEREVTPVGSQKSTPIDVRVISATNKVITEEIAAGRFRQDLFYRISTFNMEIPPLRERSDDLPLLVDYLVDRYNQSYHSNVTSLSPAAEQKLRLYSWGGNIRELENVMQRALVLQQRGEIQPEAIRFDSDSIILTERQSFQRKGFPTLAEVVQQVEEQYLRSVLAHTSGKRVEAARILGISRKSLWEKLRKYAVPEIESGEEDISEREEPEMALGEPELPVAPLVAAVAVPVAAPFGTPVEPVVIAAEHPLEERVAGSSVVNRPPQYDPERIVSDLWVVYQLGASPNINTEITLIKKALFSGSDLQSKRNAGRAKYYRTGDFRDDHFKPWGKTAVEVLTNQYLRERDPEEVINLTTIAVELGISGSSLDKILEKYSEIRPLVDKRTSKKYRRGDVHEKLGLPGWLKGSQQIPPSGFGVNLDEDEDASVGVIPPFVPALVAEESNLDALLLTDPVRYLACGIERRIRNEKLYDPQTNTICFSAGAGKMEVNSLEVISYNQVCDILNKNISAAGVSSWKFKRHPLLRYPEALPFDGLMVEDVLAIYMCDISLAKKYDEKQIAGFFGVDIEAITKLDEDRRYFRNHLEQAKFVRKSFRESFNLAFDTLRTGETLLTGKNGDCNRALELLSEQQVGQRLVEAGMEPQRAYASIEHFRTTGKVTDGGITLNVLREYAREQGLSI